MNFSIKELCCQKWELDSIQRVLERMKSCGGAWATHAERLKKVRTREVRLDNCWTFYSLSPSRPPSAHSTTTERNTRTHEHNRNNPVVRIGVDHNGVRRERELESEARNLAGLRYRHIAVTALPTCVVAFSHVSLAGR